MKKSLIAAGAIAIALLLSGCAGGEASAEKTVTVPATIGKDGAAARNVLRAAGFAVEFKSDTGDVVIAAKNWEVLSTVPSEGEAAASGSRVEVRVSKGSATPTPTVTESTSSGLTSGFAQTACDAYAKTQFPYGYNPAWILGRIASRIENDKWFLKVEAEVKNEYDAKRKVQLECTVGGTNTAPTVESFNTY